MTVPELTAEEYRALRDVIHGHCGLSFDDDLAYLLKSRLGPRVEALGLPDFAAYCRFLRSDPIGRAELEDAVDALATTETYLFREPRQLRAFADELLPALARQNARRRTLRVWSAGCSTGEEAYTVAALILRSGLFDGWDVAVFGTDIVRRVVAVARAGVYGERAFRTPEADEIRSWFTPEGERWRAGESLRRIVSFGHLNLVDDRDAALVAPVDAIFCRNVLIYFDQGARRRALEIFQAKLREGGYLLLGHAESLLHVTAELEPVHLTHDLVYRRRRRTA